MSDTRKRALLIGNSRFADARLARLFAPAEDVEALRAVLADPAIGGFDNVDVLLDQGLQAVRRAIAGLCAGTTPNELVLLYYTGHGILTAHNDFYLALGETTVDLPEADGLEAAWLRTRLDRCRARRQVLILDCCHSGAFMAGRKAGATRAVSAATFAQDESTPGGQSGLGRYVLTASDAQSFAWDATALKEGPSGTDGLTSLFTRLLVQGLSSGEAAPDREVVSVRDLYDYVFRSIPAGAPAMSPQIFVDGGLGEVVLARNPARLRPDLVEALNDTNAYTRLGAVAELEAMLRGGDVHRVATARRVLQARLETEELVRVHKRIEAVLAAAEPAVPPPAPNVFRNFEGFRDVDAPWCPEMMVLPTGTFRMGSPKNEKERQDSEGPQHSVSIGYRFAIGRHAVTVGEYRRFAGATGRDDAGGIRVWTGSEWKADASKSWRDPGFEQTDRHPVVGVSWEDASAYCEWLATETRQPYRLPSEAEWEYACRAGKTTAFSFGETITPDQANYNGNYTYADGRKGQYRQRTVEVGTLPANPWGLYEMHGNVWEWVEDIWHDTYKGAPADGSAWTKEEGKESSHYRVVRGGSWDDNPRICRSACRGWYVPDFRSYDCGFRVARTLS